MTEYNNPSHYNINGKDTMETLTEIIENNADTASEAWYLGNTLKYLIRYRHKNKVQDLEKAQDYLNRLIDQIKKQERTNQDDK